MSLDFKTVRKATNNFSSANILGQGGFGRVYKGVLPDGQEVAVKRLSRFSHEGEREFKNEVLLLAQLQHRNLVRLLGSCLEGDARLLIYEFVPDASLDRFIFDPIKRSELDWKRRYKILVGVARGLRYLHDESHLPIIHRDLKPSNILLDQDLNPKIAYSGLARLTYEIDSKTAGTFGYMAPEYRIQGQYSVKTETFAFGVLLLEIVSGQKNNSFRDEENIWNIISCARENWREDTWLDIIDPILRSNGSSSTTEMKKCIHIGLLCVQQNAADRPTMASIVRMLRGDSTALPMPSDPTSYLYMCEPEAIKYEYDTESSTSQPETIFEREFLQYDLEYVQEASNAANELGKGGFGLVYKGRFENGQETVLKATNNFYSLSMSLDFKTVQKATNNFSGMNKLGEGGFGQVYKGRLPNGQEVAVKRLSAHSRHGESEFENEILLLAKLQHRNLVRLLGSCLEGKERLLIYEFVPNASLDRFIFDPIKRFELDWERRYKILVGIARGLVYLHEDSLSHLRIIHCDPKPGNILLDQDMNPKITDFGMSRLLPMDETSGSATVVSGTIGYLAPEYMMNRQYSVKTDVFIFGVLLLEIVSGQRNCYFQDEESKGIISRAWEHLREDTCLDLIDPILRSNGSSSTTEMKKCIHIGLLCVQQHAADRPVMESVLDILCGNSTALPMPSEPPALYMYRPNATKSVTTSGSQSEIFEPEFSQYAFETIQEAANNFNDANELGKGGFGRVYKGRFENGQEVAIKRLLSNSGQGDKEFKTEVEILGRLQHWNLVRLLGYCMDGDERLLIYEFLPNSSLDRFIFDSTKRSELKWEKLYNVIKGIAQGLLYLHEDSGLKIAHLDIKSGNILLDDRMQPKIADFGLARLFPEDQTHLTVSKNGGTRGYMAPEFVFSGKCSVRADVFSFGVLLLEIVIGQRNASIQDEESMGGIINHTWKHWWAKTTVNLVDRTLRPYGSDINEILRCIHIGLLCVQDEGARPTMAKVVDMLRGNSTDLPIPKVAALWKSSERVNNTTWKNWKIWR